MPISLIHRCGKSATSTATASKTIAQLPASAKMVVAPGRRRLGCLPAGRGRFTFGAKISYLTDVSGKEVKTCHPRK